MRPGAPKCGASEGSKRIRFSVRESVTSNTRADAHAFLDFARRHRLEVTSPQYPLDRADVALADLSAGRISGAAVLIVQPS